MGSTPGDTMTQTQEALYSKVFMGGPDKGKRKIDAFMEKVLYADGSCWEWQGKINHDGYGVFYVGAGLPYTAHRIFYELSVGPLPTEVEADHLCRTPACVNPYHLEFVPHVENVRRGASITSVNRELTHCRRGHEFMSSNTRPEGGGRRCLTCKRLGRP